MSHSILHWDYDSTEKLGGLKEPQAHLVDELRVVQVVKLDVIADLWDLTDVERTIFLREIGSNFLPSLQLNEEGLALTVSLVPIHSVIDADAGSDVLVLARVERDIVFLF